MDNTVYRVWYADEFNSETYDEYSDADMAEVCEENHMFKEDYIATETVRNGVVESRNDSHDLSHFLY